MYPIAPDRNSAQPLDPASGYPWVLLPTWQSRVGRFVAAHDGMEAIQTPGVARNLVSLDEVCPSCPFPGAFCSMAWPSRERRSYIFQTIFVPAA